MYCWRHALLGAHPLERIAVLLPELDTRRDALVGEEDLPILPPLEHALGGAVHVVDDLCLHARVQGHLEHRPALESVAPRHLRCELRELRARKRLAGLGLRRAHGSPPDDQRGECEQRECRNGSGTL